jgi:hypothetical protein
MMLDAEATQSGKQHEDMNQISQAGRLREGALALLADGNSPESVANLLCMSVVELQALQGSTAPRSMDASNESAVPEAADRRTITFQAELLYREAPSTRLSHLGSGLFLLAVTAWIWQPIGMLSDTWPAPGTIAFISLLPASLGLWMVLRTRFRLVLGMREVSVRTALSVSKLDYSELVAIEYMKDVVHARGGPYLGHRLSFMPRSAYDAKVEVFIPDAQPVPRQMMMRLREISAAIGGEIVPGTGSQ